MCSALARTGSGHNLPKNHSRGPPDARLEQSCGQFRSFGWARQLCLMENGDCREAIVQWSSTGSNRKLTIILANHKYRTLSVQFLAGRKALRHRSSLSWLWLAGDLRPLPILRGSEYGEGFFVLDQHSPHHTRIIRPP